jgi:hypothetical protein
MLSAAAKPIGSRERCCRDFSQFGPGPQEGGHVELASSAARRDGPLSAAASAEAVPAPRFRTISPGSGKPICRRAARSFDVVVSAHVDGAEKGDVGGMSRQILGGIPIKLDEICRKESDDNDLDGWARSKSPGPRSDSDVEVD